MFKLLAVLALVAAVLGGYGEQGGNPPHGNPVPAVVRVVK